MQALQAVAPRRAAEKVYQFMSTPRVRPLKDQEHAVISQAVASDVPYKATTVRRYTWNERGERLVVLVHGWEGRAGNFAGLIPSLIHLGYQVVAFDAPAHGDSPETPTQMFDFGVFLAEQLPALRPRDIITHSFGSVSVAMALMENRDLAVDRWLLVTTPFTFRSRLELAAAQFGIREDVMARVAERVERDTGKRIDELNMVAYCQQFDAVREMLIVHSVADKRLPVEWSREVSAALDKCRLIELEAYGHYGILWSDELREIQEQYFRLQGA